MKVHELINVLNHFAPDSEVTPAPEVITTAEGRRYSVPLTWDTMKEGSGNSHVVEIPADPNDGSGASA